MKQYGSFTGVAERLQKIRLQLKLDCKGMAKHLGITAPTYYKNERNATAPSVNSLKKLAKKNDISLDWLLLGKEPQHYEKERARVVALEEELAALKKEKEEWRRDKAVFEEKIKALKNEHPGALKKLFSRPAQQGSIDNTEQR